GAIDRHGSVGGARGGHSERHAAPNAMRLRGCPSMPAATSLRDRLIRLGETLIIGSAGGAVLGLAHFPAGWLSGAIIAVAAAALAAETGADLRSIAMVQSVRVLVLTAGLPLGLAGLGVIGARPPAASIATAASLAELAALVAVSAAGAMLAYRIRLPGGLIVGAMAVSGVLHGSGIVKANLPPA